MVVSLLTDPHAHPGGDHRFVVPTVFPVPRPPVPPAPKVW
jgi:hypothetical protein